MLCQILNKRYQQLQKILRYAYYLPCTCRYFTCFKSKHWLYSALQLHGIKLLVLNKRMPMKLKASFSLTNINDSVKVIQLPLSKSIICGPQAPRSVWIIVIKYLRRGKISQFSCWKNVRPCSSYDLTRGSYSLSPVLPGDVPIQVDGRHDRIRCVTAKQTN